MRKIAVVNMKGGVGKTTTALHLAVGLAASGRVLLIDADPQGNVGHILRNHPPLTIEDLLARDVPLEQVLAKDVRPGVDLIAATPSAFTLEAQLRGVSDRETLLSRRLNGLEGYASVVLDSSPAVNLLTYNALLYADEMIIPVSMDPMAILGARQTLRGVNQMKKLWPDHPMTLLAVLPVAVNHATHATRASLQALANDPSLEPHVFHAGIRQCIDLTYATARQQTIWEYAPRSKGAQDYLAFVQFVLARARAPEASSNGETQTAQSVLRPGSPA